MIRPAAACPEAERRIREGEARVARQAAAVEGYELAGNVGAAERARETLAVLRTGLALALLYLVVETAGSPEEPRRQARLDA